MSNRNFFLTELAAKQGIPVSRVIGLTTLRARIGQIPGLPAAAASHALEALDACTGGAGGLLLVCGLSCREAEPFADAPAHTPAYGLVAEFARRNYYRELVTRLKAVERSWRASGGRQGRIFCNSRLPEKIIACAAGFGFYGRHSLIIHPRLGSRMVIGCLYLPSAQEAADPGPFPEQDSCGDCTLCSRACPTGAITGYAVIDQGRCLQALAARLVPLNDMLKEKWGLRLYGCQDCQAACPHNSLGEPAADTRRGALPAKLPLSEVLLRDDEALKKFLKPTALGMSWIDVRAIRRNALLAAGNSGRPENLPLVTPFLQAQHPVLREAAQWAATRLGR